VLAAGVSGGVVYEPGALCMWQCSDTCVVISCCLAALRILGRLVQFMSVCLLGRGTKFRISDVLYGTLLLRQAARYGLLIFLTDNGIC
jgi:hypothetical protein